MSNPASKADLSRQLRQTLASLDAAIVTIEALVNTLSTSLKCPVKCDVKADHRRAHRRGVPAKIATDPELQAFVSARFDALTFDQIAREAAENFTYERRVSRSSIHRWWLKTGSIRGGAIAGS
ncbi:MAG: hypothetical protein K9G72_21110 [Rhodobacteraceae bacterium]|nr:hypothetical protein [Paracoccaceae bacterium]MCF8521104.1 hypothetical protein [Paracoccaceae bacterium]